MKQFEIDQEVVPVVNVLVNGVELETIGVSGTIVEQQFTYSDEALGIDYYTHKVELLQTYIINEGTEDEQITNVFWFTDSDLGGVSPISNIEPIIDVGGTNEALAQGQSQANQSISVITEVKESMEASSPYTDIVSNVLEDAEGHSQTLNSYTLNSDEDYYREGKSAARMGDQLGFDTQVFQEIAENAKGYHDVFLKANSEYSTLVEQAFLQDEAGVTEDNEVYNIYYTNFVTGGGSQNIMIPGGDNPNAEEYETIGEPSQKTAVSGYTLLSDLVGDLEFPTGDDD